MRRSGARGAGHGVFGTYTGQQRIELEVTLNSALHAGSVPGQNDPGSIAGACSILFHCVEVPNAVRKKYEDLRGFFSIVSRRFTNLNSNWKHYATPNQVVVDSLSQPTGTCTEVMLLAVPHAANDAARATHDYIKATRFLVRHDMVVQKNLDTPSKIRTELWTNGFAPPVDFASPARLCFANHCGGDNTSLYSGGYDMSQATNLSFEFAFSQECDYRLVAVQYCSVKIDGAGILTSKIDGL